MGPGSPCALLGHSRHCRLEWHCRFCQGRGCGSGGAAAGSVLGCLHLAWCEHLLSTGLDEDAWLSHTHSEDGGAGPSASSGGWDTSVSGHCGPSVTALSCLPWVPSEMATVGPALEPPQSLQGRLGRPSSHVPVL